MSRKIGDFDRYNMNRKPNRQRLIALLATWFISFPKTFMHRARINKTLMPKKMKPPYFLLCNHNSFMDFKVMTKAIFPKRANYVIALDGYIGIEWVNHTLGGICNRKFTTSISLVRNLLLARKFGDVIILFPEAKYSLCGTPNIMPSSIGKMIRAMNLPVVTLIMHGHHINSPFWKKGNRKVRPVESEMKLLLTQEQTQELSAESINDMLAETFVYDDYAWQKKRGIRVKYKKRAEGLHHVLYQCPSCQQEYRMDSSGIKLFCSNCGKEWELTEYGEMHALSGETEFSHIPDWFEWQRSNVRQELENGHYYFERNVRVESLPNPKGFVVFEKPGNLTHDETGFTLSGEYDDEPFSLHWSVSSLYTCQVEFDYNGKGDCVTLSTNDDTFYLYPEGTEFSVTKIALATEELHRLRLTSSRVKGAENS
ncbi:MAG: hypothetical protein FWG88_08145 [Oscillospiraceae bacterium]|nr:hypothetical protein [Oscillospiraceae bacterium]